MKSDTAGTAKVFWAPAQSGTYGGFQPGDENDFTMVGDGAFHQYYLSIDTSSATTIYQLRLDVPQNATVSIQSADIANLVAPSGSGGPPSWQFNQSGNALGWIPNNGIVDMSVSGGSLNLLTFANSTILGPVSQVTNQLEWFSLFGAVQSTSLNTPWVEFNFVSNANNGAVTNVYFPLASDSAAHVYNQNVGGANGSWDGVSQLSITVSENTSLSVSQMEITSAPQGNADIAIESFGPATTFIRAGSPFKVFGRIVNRGSAVAQNVSAALNIPSGSGITIVSSPSITSTVSNGYPQTLTWTLQASEAGSFPISITVNSQNETAQSSDALRVNPAVTATPSPYVPTPVSVSSNYDIGIYYFPGWGLCSHWDPIRRFPDRTPALGFYAEGNPQVLDWQIKWAFEHGVKFFAVDWYWFSSGQSAPPGELPNNFLQAYKQAAYNNFEKFCIAYADDNLGDSAGSNADFSKIAQAGISEYFNQPGYYTIDGKPVVFIVNPGLLDSNLGGSSSQALDAARQLAVSAGFKGIYFLAASSPSQAVQFGNDGYDAVSTYSYAAAGTSDPDESPYSEMVSGYIDYWDQTLADSPIPFVIPTSPGFDLRPWAYFDAPWELVRTGSTPSLFENMLQSAKMLMDSGKAPPVFVVEAWNELGEGSYVEPTTGTGFAYLDAIRDVFTSNPPHTDITPTDVGLPTIEAQPSSALMTFTDRSDLLPWQVQPGPPFWEGTVNVANSTIANNHWTFVSNGNADLYRMGFELPAGQYSGLAVTMSVSANTWVSVYWGADVEPGPSSLRSYGFEATAGGLQTYTLPLANQPGWRGNLNLLRLTMSSTSPSNVAIQSIQFITPQGTTGILASPTQFQFLCTVGDTTVAPQTLSIGSADQSALTWSANTNGPSWLAISSTSGAAPGNISVSVNPTGLAIGLYSGTIALTGSGSSVSIPVSLSVMPAGTATSPTTPAVTVTPSSSTISTAQSLTVSVAVVGVPSPTGSVILTGGSYSSVAAALNSGTANINVPAGSMAVESDTLTSTYTPDAASSILYTPATGTASVAVTSVSYSMSATGVMVAPGTPGNSTVTISSTNGYAGTVSLICSVTSSPSGASDTPTCTATQTVTLSATTTSGTASVTVNSTAATSGLIWPKVRLGCGWTARGGALLALILVPWISKRRRSWAALILLLIGLTLIGDFTACGGGGGGGTTPVMPSNPGTTAGNYTITVTGTGNDSTKATAKTTFTLTVN
jgi:hypothetical protein